MNYIYFCIINVSHIYIYIYIYIYMYIYIYIFFFMDHKCGHYVVSSNFL